MRAVRAIVAGTLHIPAVGVHGVSNYSAKTLCGYPIGTTRKLLAGLGASNDRTPSRPESANFSLVLAINTPSHDNAWYGS